MNVLLKTRRVLMLMLVVLVSLLGLVGEGMGVAHAATLTVTNCNDSGAGSLRNAISAASSGDTITFSLSCDIMLMSTLTISTTNLTVDGSGHSVTLDGQNSVQVLYVNSGVTFILNALAIANGFTGGAGSMGGAGLLNDGGIVSISNSTFANNSAPGFDGGGLRNVVGGTVSISNSTFANNSTFGSGGGLSNDIGGTITISNSTFANNSATNGLGGGLANIFGTVTITQSIVANNTAPTGANCSGTITDGDYNLSNDTSCGFTNTTSRQNTNPQLDPAGLASNGGPTQTIALLSSSPAIDFIPAPSVCKLTSDQRGFPRPDNGESVCDIGAFEFQDPPAPPPPSPSSVPASAVCDISTTKPGTFCLNQNGNFATTDIS